MKVTRKPLITIKIELSGEELVNIQDVLMTALDQYQRIDDVWMSNSLEDLVKVFK